MYVHGSSRKSVHSIIKNPQFLPNQADIQEILPTHKFKIIFTKSHDYWVKIVDFFYKWLISIPRM